MIHIKSQEPGEEWKDWKREAEEETEKMEKIAKKGKKPVPKGRIWRKLLPFLERVFHNKCAYCESKNPGKLEVEHYRPKSEVKDENGKKVGHPGYYWLAYNWENLLLACPWCNGRGAKSSRFPIKGERAKSKEDDLDLEEPLLLNPYKDEGFSKHITFGAKGIIVGKSEKGRKTIDICKLNREHLRRLRQEEWQKSETDLVLDLKNPQCKKVIPNDMAFSAYIRVMLENYPAHLKKLIKKKL